MLLKDDILLMTGSNLIPIGHLLNYSRSITTLLSLTSVNKFFYWRLPVNVSGSEEEAAVIVSSATSLLPLVFIQHDPINFIYTRSGNIFAAVWWIFLSPYTEKQ